MKIECLCCNGKMIKDEGQNFFKCDTCNTVATHYAASNASFNLNFKAMDDVGNRFGRIHKHAITKVCKNPKCVHDGEPQVRRTSFWKRKNCEDGYTDFCKTCLRKIEKK